MFEKLKLRKNQRIQRSVKPETKDKIMIVEGKEKKGMGDCAFKLRRGMDKFDF